MGDSWTGDSTGDWTGAAAERSRSRRKTHKRKTQNSGLGPQDAEPQGRRTSRLACRKARASASGVETRPTDEGPWAPKALRNPLKRRAGSDLNSNNDPKNLK